MKEWPSGSYLNLETTVDGVGLVATGYKYNNRKVLTFLWTHGAGHTEPGDPHILRSGVTIMETMHSKRNPDHLSYHITLKDPMELMWET